MQLQLCRLASSSHPVHLNLLSDVEEQVAHDFTLVDLERKKQAETLPELVTTASLVEKCETWQDVLRELELATIGGKLWKDELLLFLRKFTQVRMGEIAQIRKETQHLTFEDKLQSQVSVTNAQTLLDNPYFQHLLRQTLSHAPFFSTVDLTQTFSFFVRLQIPTESNTMSFLVAIMQSRVNDFFPLDVLNCFNTIRLLEFNEPLLVSNLRKSLLRHLKNQTVDEISFLKVLENTPLSARFKLYRSVKRTDVLSSIIIHSCVETIKQRRYQELASVSELRTLLQALIAGSLLHKFLLATAGKFVRAHEELLTKKERTLVNVLVDRLQIEDNRLLRRLPDVRENDVLGIGE